MLLIPSYLIVLTIILLVIPAVTAIIFRVRLYNYLLLLQERVRRLITRNSRGEQPHIVQELERRFQQASIDLEHVNTAALIDQVYSQERIGLFTCEQIDYICRILPNLLLVFGLFGTFLGITLNLTALSQTVDQTNATNVSSLVAELEKPLEGMSIAFTSSLTALFFSALLTAINLIRNTTIAKYALISSLEDYLDNIYHPQVQGDTRLDKIVNRMVSQQDEFLSRFGVTVRDAVESSMGNVAKQMIQGNREVTQLAKQVYERFTEAAGTVSNAANKFDYAMEALSTNVEIFKEAAQTFETSKFPEKLAAATDNLANTQNKFSQSADSLAQTVTSMDTAVKEIQRCSQELIQLATEIKSANQTSLEVLELHQINQTSLGEIIPQLKQGADSFAKASDKLDNLEQRIAQRVESLNSVIESLTQLLQHVQAHTDSVESSFDLLSQEFINQNQTFLKNLEGYFNQIGVKFDTFKLDYEDLFQKNNVKIIEGYKIVGERMIAVIREQTQQNNQNINQQNNRNYQMYQNVMHKLEECIKQLSGITHELSNFRLTSRQSENQNNNKNNQIIPSE
ncbi:MAG: hypothetical protein QNJ47_13890 [Nostocaceae cyanobacterium]|nr:hypothetical protein [Nostocaceae cyanobacterium]